MKREYQNSDVLNDSIEILNGLMLSMNRLHPLRFVCQKREKNI